MANEKKIKKIETMVNDEGVFVKKGTRMNIMCLEDVYECIDDDIMWLISLAREQAEKIKMLEEAFDTKTRVHDKLNKDYIELKSQVR